MFSFFCSFLHIHICLALQESEKRSRSGSPPLFENLDVQDEEEMRKLESATGGMAEGTGIEKETEAMTYSLLDIMVSFTRNPNFRHVISCQQYLFMEKLMF